MLSISDSLRAISLYPTNPLTLQNICEECGLDGKGDATQDVRQSSDYKRAKAKVYQYLAAAPQVSEAGASFNFTSEERKRFSRLASDLLDEIGEGDAQRHAVGFVREEY